MSAGAAREVVADRGEGTLYDETVLTEDNEFTLRLLHMGRKVVSPKDCTLHTEVMPTWRMLAKQRLRWKRGAIQNLLQFGWTPVTRPYWARQALSLMGVFVTLAYMLTIALGIVFTGISVYPVWLAVTGIFAVERVVTVRERGFWMMLLGGLIFVEFFYDVFLQGVQARAYADTLMGRTGRW
jgi:cellulose synthase/poly-beta-1,6-N-acetylglucosamine synthase-like glycosyltransferase